MLRMVGQYKKFSNQVKNEIHFFAIFSWLIHGLQYPFTSCKVTSVSEQYILWFCCAVGGNSEFFKLLFLLETLPAKFYFLGFI